MPFAIVAVPFDAYRDLPSPQHRWLMICLARYADRAGKCWPSIRQLAADAKMSKSSVQRYLVDLSHLGVFSRERRPGGRYVYVIATSHKPGFQVVNVASVPAEIPGVPQRETQKAIPIKHRESPAVDLERWVPRLRSWGKSRFWLPQWGPRPGEPGCWAPLSPTARISADAAAPSGPLPS